MPTESSFQQATPPRLAATTVEISAAIDALTHEELEALEVFARKRVEMLGNKRHGRDYEDLLQEAITDTLSGDRSWYKDVDFCHYVYWAMHSISNRWIKAKKDVVAGKRLDPATMTDDGGSWNLQTNIPSDLPSPERLAWEKEELERIEHLLQDDPAALQVFGFLRQEFKGPEIQEATGLTQSAYETIVKRMRSKVRRSNNPEVIDATSL